MNNRRASRGLVKGLAGMDLSWQNWSRAKLSNTDLSKTSFVGADLSYADLSFANLKEADLSGAVLTGADLSGAFLHGANLTNANMTKVKFGYTTDMTSTNLDGADMTNSIHVTETDVDFSYAKYTPRTKLPFLPELAHAVAKRRQMILIK